MLMNMLWRLLYSAMHLHHAKVYFRCARVPHLQCQQSMIQDP